MDEWKYERVADKSEWSGREIWKKEKVSKWEMPSYTYVSKSTDPSSQCLHEFEIQVPGR